jgi:PAS domain S-box-containing protein
VSPPGGRAPGSDDAPPQDVGGHGATPLDALRVRAIFDQAAVGMTLVDDDGVIVAANAAFAAIVGRPAESLRGVYAATLSPPEDAAVTRQPVRELRDGAPHGAHRREALPSAGRRDPVGGADHLAHHHPDRRRARGRAGDRRDRARHHGAEASRGAGGARRRARPADRPRQPGDARSAHRRRPGAGRRGGARARADALLLLDVDHFTAVNEALGPAAGDALLAAVGERLTTATRGCDTVARVGDDAFGVLLTGVGAPADVDPVVARVTAALRAPFTLAPPVARPSHPTGEPPRDPGAATGAGDVRVGVSVGVAHAAGIETSEGLLRHAAAALARAKALGRGRVEYAAAHAGAPRHRRFALEAGLRRALDALEHAASGHALWGPAPTGANAPADGLWLAYQPIVELASERVVAVEALARWRDPGLGDVSPGDFIPVAEAAGLCVPLGWWVLDTACAQLAAWDALGMATLQMSVNLSAGQVQDARLVDVVRETLARHGLAPSRLMLELTESATPHDLEAARGRLLALRALGVQLALDDFGTGYGSLVYLERFPVHAVKIDRRFVAALTGGGAPGGGAPGGGAPGGGRAGRRRERGRRRSGAGDAPRGGARAGGHRARRRAGARNGGRRDRDPRGSRAAPGARLRAGAGVAVRAAGERAHARRGARAGPRFAPPPRSLNRGRPAGRAANDGSCTAEPGWELAIRRPVHRWLP